MTESLLDGSYWALSSGRRQPKKVDTLTYKEDHIPVHKLSAPVQLTEEQKEKQRIRQKERNELRKSLEKSKVEEETRRNQKREKYKEKGHRIFEGVLLGSKKVAQNLALLEKRNVRGILNISDGVNNFFEDNSKFTYKRIKVADSSDSNLLESFHECAEFIQDTRKNSRVVLVHCQEGMSRSPTIVLAFAIKYMSLSLEEAYNHLVTEVGEDNIKINDGFKRQLMEWEINVRTSVSLDFFGVRVRGPRNGLTEISEQYAQLGIGEAPKSPGPKKRCVGFRTFYLIQSSSLPFFEFTKLTDLRAREAGKATGSPEKKRRLSHGKKAEKGKRKEKEDRDFEEKKTLCEEAARSRSVSTTPRKIKKEHTHEKSIEEKNPEKDKDAIDTTEIDSKFTDFFSTVKNELLKWKGKVKEMEKREEERIRRDQEREAEWKREREEWKREREEWKKEFVARKNISEKVEKEKEDWKARAEKENSEKEREKKEKEEWKEKAQEAHEELRLAKQETQLLRQQREQQSHEQDSGDLEIDQYAHRIEIEHVPQREYRIEV